MIEKVVPLKGVEPLLRMFVTLVVCLFELQVPADASEPVMFFDFKSEKLALATADVQDAQPSFDANANPAVMVRLAPDAARAFALMTSRHVGESMDVIVCGQVLLSPRIMSPIEGGQIQISGALDVQQVTKLAIVIRTGGCGGVQEKPISP
jgi:preprotein translocase subunit SecD